MTLLKNIKSAAKDNRTKIQTSEATRLEKLLNSLFLLPKLPEQEIEFMEHILNRHHGVKERVGLHASALIAPQSEYCTRAQVLSLFYKPTKSSEQHSVNLLRIFEEGNAIHEKWQRLFVRAEWAKPTNLDKTRYNADYMVSFTPDIVCRIPTFYDVPMIGEIKSVNTYQFQKMASHPTAKKQLQWYMHLFSGYGIHKGFVLCEDKNTQDIKVEVYDYDASIVQEFIERASEIMRLRGAILEHGAKKYMPDRPKDASGASCKRCSKCSMVLSCYGLPGGRIKLRE